MKIQDKINKLQSLIEQGYVYIEETPVFYLSKSKEAEIEIERLVWVDLGKWNEEDQDYEIVDTIKCQLLHIDFDDSREDADIVFLVKPIDELPSDFNFEDYNIESWLKIYYDQISSFQINHR